MLVDISETRWPAYARNLVIRFHDRCRTTLPTVATNSFYCASTIQHLICVSYVCIHLLPFAAIVLPNSMFMCHIDAILPTTPQTTAVAVLTFPTAIFIKL
jgi:hypothetical protein